MAIKIWHLPDISNEDILKTMSATGYPRLLSAVLAEKTSRETVNITAKLPESFASPYTIRDMEKAVERIHTALAKGEKTAVFGDYDCDGITATVLMTSYLQSVGADMFYYIPSREKEGYGLNNTAIKMLADLGVTLIITVDNGISSHNEVEYARELGVDVIITDHHTPRDTLPNAVAVVNPHRRDCESEFKELAGVGVAFKLVCALEDASCEEMLEYYSDIVTLGTISDVVPLLGENRLIVKHGLEKLCEADNNGIIALLKTSSLEGKTLSGESIAFGIIPRINAAGRMDCVESAVEMFLTDSYSEAEQIALQLDEQNEARKAIEQAILKEIEDKIAENPDILKERIVVISGENWHQGVVGIVSAKITENYGKPSILISSSGGMAKGSGRSIPGFSLIEAITACREHLEQYGGHVLAAGLTLKTESIPAFRRAICEYARQNYIVMPIPEINISAVITSRDLNINDIKSLEKLEPYGAGNEAPSFLFLRAKVEGIYPTADGNHLRLRFSFGGEMYYAVYFRMREEDFIYEVGNYIDMVAAVSINTWNGSEQISIKIKDIRPADTDEESLVAGYLNYLHFSRDELSAVNLSQIAPTRDDIAYVYRYIKKLKSIPASMRDIYFRINNSEVDFCKMSIAIDVLLEMGLAVSRKDGISIVENPAKIDLENSRILAKLK